MRSLLSLDRHLFDLARRRPKAVLLGAVACAAVALFIASRVTLDSDFLALMPAENQVVGEFRDTMERFGSLDLMLVGLRLPDGPTDAAFAYADAMAEELRALPEVDWLEYHTDEVMSAATSLVRWAPLYMGESDLDELLETVSSTEALESEIAQLAETLRSPADLPFKELRKVDPLGMIPKAWGSFGAASRDELTNRFDDESGYAIDPGGRFILLLVKPARTAADVPFGRRLLDEVESAAERATAQWREDGWEGAAPGLLLAGGHVVTVHDARLIASDLGFGTPTAVIAVVLLFAIAFSRPLALVIAFVPLFMGLILTAAFAVLSLGHLNAVTATFAALLVGLGIDFVIVLYGRYVEERRAGASFEEAMEAIRHHTVPSVRLGAVTTSVTFCAFLISDFAGLWELGLITGAGVLLVMVAVFAVLPAILTLLEQRRDTPPPAVRGFGSRALMRFSHRRPRLILGINVALTLLLGVAALDVVYDDDALNLRSTRNPGLLNQQELMEAFGLRFTPYMVRIDGATESEAIARARDMLPKLRELADGERLARVESVAPWVPEEERQRRQIERLEAFEKAPEAVAEEVEAALRDQGLNPKAFREGIDQLVEALSIDAPQGPSALEGTTVGHLLGRYVAVSEDRVSTIIYCYPPPGQWRRFPPPDLVEVVAESEHGAVLTGPVIVSAELKNVVWQDATTAALIGALLVTLFLAFDLGGLKAAILSLIPLGIGLVWMLGGMALSGVVVNFLNIFVFTMILGIGVDYGIHLLHRWKESGDLQDAIDLAPAITVAALTTVLGFGSLVLSSFPGLRSMGAAAIFGVLSVAWLGLTLLPALAGLRRSPSDSAS